MLTPGFWHSTYFCKNYWIDDYWQDYAYIRLQRRGWFHLGASVRMGWY